RGAGLVGPVARPHAPAAARGVPPGDAPVPGGHGAALLRARLKAPLERRRWPTVGCGPCGDRPQPTPARWIARPHRPATEEPDARRMGHGSGVAASADGTLPAA